MAPSKSFKLLSSLVLSAISTFFAKAQQLPLDPTFAAAHSCNTTCQQLVTLGASYEASQHVFPSNDPFYNPSGPFPTQPGQPIHVEQVTDLTNYSIPSSLTMSRFTYTTANVNGTVLPASAYILWPYGSTQDSSKFKVVAWAHGTTGGFAPCAPSNYQNLQYNFQVPFALALDGYAVIAPDYDGLGVGRDGQGKTIPHVWGLAPAQANDLAHAVEAARLAFPGNVAEEFVVMGHSEGGGAAWAFAQRQAQIPVSGYRGTVALAPVTNIVDQLSASLANPQDPTLAITQNIQLLVISSVSATFPEAYNFTGASDLGRQRWEVLEKVGGCLPTQSLLFSDIIPLTKVGRANWTENPWVRAWGEIASNGGKKFGGPLLVLAAEGDTTVPVRFIEDAVDETCQEAVLGEESLELVTFERLEHFPLIQGAKGTWRRWIEERLADEGEDGIGKGCKKRKVQGFRQEDTKTSSAPNWLLSVPGPKEGFKAAL